MKTNKKIRVKKGSQTTYINARDFERWNRKGWKKCDKSHIPLYIVKFKNLF